MGRFAPMAAAHGFLDLEYLTRPCTLRGFLDGAFFHLSDPRGHANHDPGTHQAALIVDFGNKIAKHGFGDFKVRNHHRPSMGRDGLNIAGSLAEHAASPRSRTARI